MSFVHKIKNKTPLDCSGGSYLKASRDTYFLSHYHLCSLNKKKSTGSSIQWRVSKQLSYLYICPNGRFYAGRTETLLRKERRFLTATARPYGREERTLS